MRSRFVCRTRFQCTLSWESRFISIRFYLGAERRVRRHCYPCCELTGMSTAWEHQPSIEFRFRLKSVKEVDSPIRKRIEAMLSHLLCLVAGKSARWISMLCASGREATVAQLQTRCLAPWDQNIKAPLGISAQSPGTSIQTRINPASGQFTMIASSWYRQAEISVSAPPGSFASLSIPTRTGFAAGSVQSSPGQLASRFVTSNGRRNYQHPEHRP